MACYPNFHTFLEMEYLYVRLFACLFPILGFIQNHLFICTRFISLHFSTCSPKAWDHNSVVFLLHIYSVNLNNYRKKKAINRRLRAHRLLNFSLKDVVYFIIYSNSRRFKLLTVGSLSLVLLQSVRSFPAPTLPKASLHFRRLARLLLASLLSCVVTSKNAELTINILIANSARGRPWVGFA